MTKPKVNYWINMLMLLLFIVVAISGIVLFVFRLSNIKGGNHEIFLGITNHYWLIMHYLFVIIFVIFVLTHVILKGYWTKDMTKRILKLKKKAEI
ncbi:MAG: DUF4405 domain-containing protein [Nanoarchaeota archaeon]|nr:DUF4405 domain-containing protein [Nanoarchaeota archaeon]